ncbi:unnamed protein product [Hermetia illucens]|uniref:DUF243 domain-containing protein n=1 Tax=Hermetia illucens TaxID=343691 RepID=A0A7R8UCU3_HERIL|nr:uncharacterized protein LOC119661761 [Hermetia illucens]CAD7077599.1 unnamed protein product [Hermetia illucens]
MRAILGSLSLVVLLAYPAVGGISYNYPTAAAGFTPGFGPIYTNPLPEIYPVGDHGLLGGVNAFAGADLGYPGAYAAPAFGGFPEPIVSKYFTFHSAPEEPPEVRVRHLAIGQPRKTYRVVFIKAPSQNPPITRLTASFAPKEEKTVIYVLSKKPETEVINEIVQPPPTEPSKPEVVFVKYKTPEEAIHAQQTIQAQYDALGGSTKVSDEGVAPLASVIGSLGQTDQVVDIHPTTDNLVHVLSTRSPKIVKATPKRKH